MRETDNLAFQLLLNPNGGNVGIGTNSPSTRLEVAASATTSVDIAHFSNSNDVVKIKHALDGLGSGIISIFDASNNEDVRLSAQSNSWFNAGNVGIGTTSPLSKLQVGLSTSNAGSTLAMLGAAESGILSALSLVNTLGNSAAGYGTALDFHVNAAYSPTGRIATIAESTATPAALAFYTYNSGLNEKMRITSAGNVGIGLTNPADRLDLYDSDDNVGMYFHTATSGTGVGNGLRVGQNNANAFVWNYEATPLSLATGGTARLTINATGGIRFNTGYGAGTLVTDASGNVTVSSGGGAGGPYLPLSAGQSYPLTGTLYGTSTNFSGNGDYAGSMTLGTGASTAEASLTIGQGRTDSGYSYIDLVGGTTYSDYGLRIIRGNTGSNADSLIIHRGQGNLNIQTTDSASILLKTAGNEKMRITSTGNVGIGTTSPAAGLQVAKGGSTIPAAGSSTASAVFGNSTSDDNYGVAIGANSSGVGYISSQRTDGAATTYNLAIQPNGGNVGIGTASPTQDLTLYRSSGDTNFLISSNNGASQIFFGDTESDNIGKIDYDHSDNSLNFAVNASEKMRIDSSGNVGIGVTGPNAKLEVSYTNTGIGAIVGNTTHNSQLQIYTAAAGKNSEIWFGDASDADVGKIDYDHANDSMSFFIGATKRLSFDSAGTMLLGDTTTAYQTIFFDPTPSTVYGNGTLQIQPTTSPGSGIAQFTTNFADRVGGGTTKHNVRVGGTVTATDFIGGSGAYLPLAGGTMTGTNGVVFPDNFILNIGTANDLTIKHNATDSFIENHTGHLSVVNYSNDKDIIFWSDDGTGGIAKYLVIDGANEVNQFYKDASFYDGIRANFGNSNDLQIYHDGSNSYIKDTGTGSIIINTDFFRILNSAGNSQMFRCDANDSVQLYYNNSVKLVTTNTGVTVTGAATATTFLGDLNGTINTATTGVTQVNAINNTTIATTAYVNNKIALIPAGLVFQGTWNAATNTPTLTSGSGTTGNFYIVSVAGSTNLDGITDWKVGDWAVFIEQGASDQWEKIDNSSVLDGFGTGQSVTKWDGSGTSNTLTNGPITFSGNNSTFAGDVTVNGSHLTLANGTTSAAATDYLYIGGSGLASADAAIYIGNGGGNTTDGYGYRIYYSGTGQANNNKLIFKSENYQSAEVDMLTFTADGKSTFSQDATFAGDVNITQTTDVGVLNTTNLDNGSAVGLSLTYPTSNVAAGDGLAIAIGIAGRGRSYIANSNITNNLDASNLEFYTEGGGVINKVLTLGTEKNATFAGNVTINHDSGDSLLLTKSTTEPSLRFEGDTDKDFVLTVSGETFTITQNNGATDILTLDHDTKNATFAKNVGIGGVLPLSNGGSGATVLGVHDAVGSGWSITKYTNTTTGTAAADGSIFGIIGSNAYVFNYETNGSVIFGTASSERMRINSNGNVGIGTTSPQAALHVAGSFDTNSPTGNGVLMGFYSGTHGYMQLNGPSGGYIDFSTSGTDHKGRILYDNTGNYLRLDTNGSEKLRINSAGNVGIGTTSPDAKLNVTDGGTQVAISTTYLAHLQSASNCGLAITAGASSNNYIAFGDSDNYDEGIINYNNSTRSFTFRTADGALDDLVIDSAGNVGIGQPTPLNSLDVYRATGDASIRIQANTAADSTILKFRNSNADADITVDYTASNLARMVFTTDNSGGYVPVLSLEANRDTLMYGNVGIGTTTPNYKLTVSGGINAGGVVTYSKVAGSLNTTGYAIAGLGTVFNGASAFFTFTASGGTGQYQRVVYSCAGVGTNWVVYKVIDEGTNVLDIEASATSAATIVFTFKTRSGTQAYSPRVVIQASGHSIISTYA